MMSEEGMLEEQLARCLFVVFSFLIIFVLVISLTFFIGVVTRVVIIEVHLNIFTLTSWQWL